MSLENLTNTTWKLGYTSLHQVIKEIKGMETFLNDDANVFTLLAPTDEAFAAFEDANPGLLDSWRNSPKMADVKLREVLYYHMLEGRIDFETLLTKHHLTTFAGGKTIPIRLARRTLFLGDGKVVKLDLRAKNGVIHAIDSLLTPPEGWSFARD